MLKAAELVREPILLREEGSGMRRFVEQYLEQNGVLRQQLRTSIDMNSTEAIITAVESGLGVGFVPCMALEKSLKIGSVRIVPLQNGPIQRDLSAVLLNGPEPKGPIGQLLDRFRDYGTAQRRDAVEAETRILPEKVVTIGNSTACPVSSIQDKTSTMQ